MTRHKKYFCNRGFWLFSFLVFILSRTDPVTPEFEYQDGLVFIESFASTTPGASFAIINQSETEFGFYGVNFLEGAVVSFENVDTGRKVPLTEAGESYIPPREFAVTTGEEWKLNVLLADGRRYESEPERVLETVPIKNIELEYDPELVFREIGGGKFVPGHAISVSFDDPADQENHYYWSFRSFESLMFCEKCFDGVLRDGNCIPFDVGFLDPYFDYICEVDCWRIRFPESVAIFDDAFSNGKTITNFKVGDALLYTKENMVVEVQQFSISAAAHEYYSILKDLVDNNGGLNAPPPAALIGNLMNPDNPAEFVFGRFTAAATSTASSFLDRSGIMENQIELRDPIIVEPTLNSPYPPPATLIAPCEESKFRTAIRPPGWIE
ncbi:DUF4249 domain-containing protein [Maribacter halichondriae]|uniref:DUF4249 domain-containing protein n=1 Tax=Maribacter halichondriae TaxID=2980554 RepID=UPI002359C780|nr:DUF4249 domain-containing protein [Maribacter sp. Hal144]